MSLQTYWRLLLFSHTHTHCCLSLYYLVKSGFGLLSLLWRAVCLIFLMSASSCVVCVLTVVERRRRLLRGLRVPCWEGLGPGPCLWSRFQMFPLMGEKHVGSPSQTKPEPKLNQAWPAGGGGSFCWQASSLPCRSDSLMAVRAELI